MDPRCRVEMLGPLRLIQSHQTVTRFGTQKSAWLLAFLALRLGPQPREQIIDLFWPDMDLPAGRNNLSTALSSLRRQIEPPGIPRGAVLVTTHACVGLNPAAVTTDVAEFERLLHEAEGTGDPKKRAAVLERALALYSGDFQPGNYQDWSVREAERLQARRVGALDRFADDLEAMSRFEEAAAVTGQRLTADPYAEAAWAALVRRHVLAGHSAAACEAARRCERFFEEEFGTGSSVALSRAIGEALGGHARRSETAPARLVAPPELRVQTGEAVTEDGAKREAAPSGSGASTDTLPFWLSRFFDREAELAQLAAMLLPSKEPLSHPDPSERPCRLVTVTGPGGAGKTRLAAEFARRTAERFGAWCGFVALADLQAPEQIPSQIALALRLPSSPAAGPLDQVIAFFGERDRPGAAPCLLILDNMEHLLAVDAGSKPFAEGGVAGIVAALLKNTAGLSILCTSRHRLALQGERLLPLGPLDVPDAPEAALSLEEVACSASVRLYLDRAQGVRPDFGLTRANALSIASLCRALEGSPLALELAASWVRLLPPSRIGERLAQGQELPKARHADLPARHRSLAAALDWSWRLLTEPQKRLLARLSVFRGGCTPTGAEAVCREPVALEILAELGDASLVETAETGDGGVRARLLETVRTFSRQKLEEQGEVNLLQRWHADFFGSLAAQAAPSLRGPEQRRWLDALEAEHDNLRAALDWYVSSPGDTEDGLRLVSALAPFWRARGYLQEGHDRSLALLSRPEADPRTAVRAAALNRAGELTTLLTAYSEAETAHAEALLISREVRHVPSEADALLGLGNIHYWRQDYPAAALHLKGSLALRTERGGDWNAEHHRLWGEAATYHSLGNLAMRWGNPADAPPFFDRALALRRGQGDALAAAATLGALGQTARAAGDHGKALQHIVEAMRLFEAAGQWWTVALCLSDISQVAEARGEAAASVRLSGAAAALRAQFHFPPPPAEQSEQENRRTLLRERLGEAPFAAAWAEGYAFTCGQAVEYALAYHYSTS